MKRRPRIVSHKKIHLNSYESAKPVELRPGHRRQRRNTLPEPQK